jgi:glycosyltransferase involved in cell wall biosynthesis
VDSAVFAPVDHPAARARTGCDLPASAPVIVYVGRVLPRKDIRNVVRALAILRDRVLPWARDCRLLIVGGETRQPDPEFTPELEELRALADALCVGDRVILAGKRNREELRDFYGAGDVAVTTPWYEPFGLTPLEAMACGRPVIGANVGGIAFTLAHGETGLLVPPKDPESLADAFTDLLTDQNRRAQMGANARDRVLTHFTWSAVADQTAALYDRLITANRFREASRRGGEQASSRAPGRASSRLR